MGTSKASASAYTVHTLGLFPVPVRMRWMVESATPLSSASFRLLHCCLSNAVSTLRPSILSCFTIAATAMIDPVLK